MGSILTGLAVIGILLIVVFTALATTADPFLAFAGCVALFLIFTGMLVDLVGPQWADVAAKIFVSLLIIGPLTWFLLETFVFGEPKFSTWVHGLIGQTSPDVVMKHTYDPSDDDYDFSRLSSRYDDHHDGHH